MVGEKNGIYDVVVVGGGSSGIAAAVGAAKLGARTLLLERNPYLGGQVTNCGIPTYDGFFTRGEPFEQVVGGVGQQVIDILSQTGGCDKPRRSPWGNVMLPVNNEAVKVALDRCIEDSGAEYLLYVRVAGANVADGKIQALTCLDDNSSFTVSASAFVDATGECNLATLAGGEVFTPTPEEMQVGTLLARYGGVPKDTTFSTQDIKQAIACAKAAGIGPMSKESGLIMRITGSEDVVVMLANERVNGLDAGSLTKAEMAARKQVMAYLQAFRRFLPGFEHAYINQSGPQIGIRETRHTIGDYTISRDDVVQAKRHHDAVARGCWPVERHSNPGTLASYDWIQGDSYYDIPLRALKVKGLKNLWSAGRSISCDLDAFASLRVMGTAFATGHAAGVAAAVCKEDYLSQFAQVKQALLQQNAII